MGAAGKTLDRLLAANGIPRDGYGRANICRCRPPDNRKPKPAEVSECLPYLADLIEACQPKVLLLGARPPLTLLGRERSTSVSNSPASPPLMTCLWRTTY